MKKKQIALIILVIVAVSGIFIWQTNSKPENKVAKLEQTIVDTKETSGYNACIKKVEEMMKKQEDCTAEKIREKGFTDGLDCIKQYEDPICQNTERYNAGTDSYNECIPISNQVTNLSKLDCMKLLENK